MTESDIFQVSVPPAPAKKKAAKKKTAAKKKPKK